jgi:NAD(P)-dependent dehydrogenase (short-subunit alcohol dehydrogenase family)
MEISMKKFDGKTVIVTGGGGGIGGATCRRFAAEGAKVAVYDLNLVAAEAVAQAITVAGGAPPPSTATSPTAPAWTPPWPRPWRNLGPSTCW